MERVRPKDPARRQGHRTLDRREPRGSVIQEARQDHADDSRTECDARTPEHRVDRRPIAVLFRAAQDPNPIGLEQQVMTGRRDINSARDDRFRVSGGDRLEASSARQDARKHTRAVFGEVDRDEQRRVEIGPNRTK